MTLSDNARLGPYEILGPLGAGGMGEVYKARDTRLDRVVAIKVLPSHLSGDEMLRQRLEREARAVSGLNHPNICTLHDIGHHEGVDYLVLEYLEGETLAQRLEGGPLPTGETLEIAVAIAGALSAAHGKGVMHRDLKPGNIMLAGSGVKLLDFGLAKPTADSVPLTDLTSTPTVNSPLTAVGTLMGTFQYMAPEQIEAGNVDTRTDIFAFGCILYEMITGRRAFDGKSQASVIAKILELEPTPLTTLMPATPPAVVRVVNTCLAKDPGKRWQTAVDLERELRWLNEGEITAQSHAGGPLTTGAAGPATSSVGVAGAPLAAPMGVHGPAHSNPHPAPARAGSKLPWMVAGVLALACAGLAWMTLYPSETTNPALPVFASIPPPTGGSFLSTGLQAGPVSVAPDGLRMVFLVRDNDGRERLWYRELAQAQSRAVPDTDAATRVFWSPDSSSIGFFADGKLRRVDVDGGPVMTLADAPDPRGGSWNRDGQILFTPNFMGPIHLISEMGGTTRQVTVMNEELKESTHRYPFFLPDGRHFLFLSRKTGAGSGYKPTILIGDIDSAARIPVAQVASSSTFAAGHILYVQDYTLMAQAFDPVELEIQGPPRPLVQRLRFDRRFSLGVFSASETLLAYQTGEGQKSLLSIYDRAGNLLRDMGEPSEYMGVSVAPDGGRIAFSLLDAGTGVGDIWMQDLENGLRTRVSFGSNDEHSPLWRSDSESILYAAVKNNERYVMAKSLGGRGSEEKLAPIAIGSRISSLNDQYLIYDVEEGFHQTIMVRSLADGSESVAIGGGDEPESGSTWGGELSPDGRWLAYASDETGRAEIYIMPFPEGGGRWQVSPSGGEEIAWRADGRELFYLGLDGSLMAADIRLSQDNLQVGTVRNLFRIPTATTPGTRFDVFPDGQTFILNRSLVDAENEPVNVLMNWTALLDER